MKNFNLAAIHHQNKEEYRYCNSDGTVVLMLRTGRGDWEKVTAYISNGYGAKNFYQSTQVQMYLAAQDEMFDYYKIKFDPEDPRIRYIFALENKGIKLFYNPDGVKSEKELVTSEGVVTFVYAYAYPAEPKPEWARGCVAYQIFPDRFCRKGKMEKNIERWNSKNITSDKFFGGNIAGMISSVPYLKRLGIQMVYMTPIFLSDTSHRYNTFDYYQIDPMIGTKEELKELVDTLHKAGIKIMLDGVFNHSGQEFAPYKDAIEKRENSEYYDWFFFGAKESPECGYACFAHEKYMPKLNLKNPAAAEYFANVGRYWIRECGIDGWRLDVSPEVHPDFWRYFRREVKKENPDILIVAECWDDSREWCNNGDMFDSTMHYVWSRAVWQMFGGRDITIKEFDARINRAFVTYPEEVTEVLWNILGSHDTMRILTRVGERLESLEAAAFFQMTCPGIPIIYYGDEIGMKGENDPYCRYPMKWNDTKENNVLRYYKLLAHLRQKYPSLMYGDYKTYLVDDEAGIYAYTRNYKNESMLCIICAKDIDQSRVTIAIPNELAKRIYLRDEISSERYNCANANLVLPYKYGKCYAFPITKTLDQLMK